jgi:hypothetical protein
MMWQAYKRANRILETQTELLQLARAWDEVQVHPRLDCSILELSRDLVRGGRGSQHKVWFEARLYNPGRNDVLVEGYGVLAPESLALHEWFDEEAPERRTVRAHGSHCLKGVLSTEGEDEECRHFEWPSSLVLTVGTVAGGRPTTLTWRFVPLSPGNPCTDVGVWHYKRCPEDASGPAAGVRGSDGASTS